jgi:hypothetical protein
VTDPVEERAYHWQRRFVFAITLAVVIALAAVLCALLA